MKIYELKVKEGIDTKEFYNNEYINKMRSEGEEVTETFTYHFVIVAQNEEAARYQAYNEADSFSDFIWLDDFYTECIEIIPIEPIVIASEFEIYGTSIY